MSEAVTEAAPASEGAAPAQADAAPAAATAAPAAEPTLLGGDPPADDPAATPEGEKPAPEKSAADAVPETYVITLPEGEAVDDGRLTAYQGALKDAALTQGQADKLTPFLLGQMKAIQEQQLAAWADTTKSWRESVTSDPEIGGAKLNDSRVAAARARDQFGSPEFKALLADTNLGIGNHPALFKFLVNVGRRMGEDLRGAEKQGGTAPSVRDMSDVAMGKRMFPGMAS